MIYVDPDFQDYFKGFGSIDDFLRIDAALVRDFKNRKTGRFELGGKGFYIKKHYPCGMGAVLDELLHLRKPHIGARHEWAALNQLQVLGIPSMRAAAFGQEGNALARQKSFLVTEELTCVRSLEDVCRPWPLEKPAAGFKNRLIERVSGIAKVLHDNGINHRDFYICHFLLDESGPSDIIQRHPKLFLIDLHRAQMRQRVPFRWRVKDIGGLYFSAMDIGLNRHDIFRFMQMYTGKRLRQTLQEDRAFWNAVRRRAMQLYRKEFGKEPRILMNTDI